MDIRTILILSLLFLIPTTLYPQQTRQVRGRLMSVSKNSEPAEALPYASILILNENDSSLVKGTTTDKNGYFRITYSPNRQNDYIVHTSYLGYAPVYIKLDPGNTNINLGDIVLKEADIKLDEITITAHAKPIRQVGDTTVINVSAYKTPEGAYLEELVKRIPGLEYDTKEKTLTYNGLSISSIQVNGEPFFDDNLAMALENLPVELISEIKVYDKKSELEKITGVKSTRKNYILDLQTKNELNGTLMLSGKVGQGNKSRKDYEVLANYFKKGGDNFSIIGHSGNQYLRTDYKGNIQHSIGANYTKNFNKKLILNGNVYYNGGKNGSKSNSYTEEYLSVGNKYQYSGNENVNKNDGINAAMSMRWEINEKTFFNISGRVNANKYDNTVANRQATFTVNPGLDLQNPFDGMNQVPDDKKINAILMDALMENTHTNYSFNADFTRKFNKRGTSISLTAHQGDTNGKSKDFTNSSTTFYQLENSLGNDSVLYRNQYQYSPTKDRNAGAGLLFTHPVTKKLQLQFSYDLRYSKQDSDRSAYDLSGFTEEQSSSHPAYLPPGYQAGYIDSLSNRSRSTTLNQGVTLRVNYSDTIWNVISDLTIMPERRSLDQKTGLFKADTVIRNVGLNPSVNISWQKDDNQIQLNYNGNTRAPNLQDLIALTDNRDPLNIVRGNPHLKPAYFQYVRLEMRQMKKGFFVAIGWRHEVNSHTRAVIYNRQTGGRESYPVNINGNRSIDGYLNYQKRISDFGIYYRGGAMMYQNVNLLNEGDNEQPERSKTRTSSVDSNIRLSYLPQWGNIDLVGDWRYQHSNNSLNQSTTDTHNYNLGLNANANLPGNISFKTDANYIFRNGTHIDRRKDDQVVWNAGITWRFLKKKQAELSVVWSDILNQEKNYYRNVTANGLSEYRNRQIGSYFLVSLRYRFNKELH